MAEEQPKKRRRIRPAAESIRSMTEKARIDTDKAGVEKKSRKVLRSAFKPLSFTVAPLKWTGRHFIPRYFRNSFAELRLVTWPNWKQSRQLTTAVILFAIVFGFIVTILDYGLDKVFKKVFLK